MRAIYTYIECTKVITDYWDIRLPVTISFISETVKQIHIIVVATTHRNGTRSLLTSAKLSNRLSSSRDYKRTWQGALAVLILYLYYRLLVHAITIITCPYVYVLSSYSITHPYMFSLRPPCFLYVPWCHTFNFCCICVHHVYTIRNSCSLTLSLTLTLYLDSSRSF